MLVQPIINLNNNKYSYYTLKSSHTMPTFKAGQGGIVKCEKPILYTMESIADYLNRNKHRINKGNIFNEPVFQNKETLLMSFLQIIPQPNEITTYKSILFDMSQMPDINYNQQDSMGISALEWIMIHEDPGLLSLIKGKELEQKDPLLSNAYGRIKDVGFKNKLIEMDIYRPPVYETLPEQKALVNSILQANKLNPDASVFQKIIESLQNNDKHILNESAAILRKLVQNCNSDDLSVLPKLIDDLKDESGNINLEEAASTLAKKEQSNLSVKTIVESNNLYKEAMEYMDTAKAYFDKVGIEYIQDKKDGLLIISDFNVIGNKNINYNKLLKCIKAIIGHGNFAHIDEPILSLGNLQHACGGLFFPFGLEDPGKLESVGVNIDFGYPKFQKKHEINKYSNHTWLNDLKTLGKIRWMGGTVNFEFGEIKDLSTLEYVAGDVVLEHYSRLKAHDFKDVKISGRIIQL